MSVRADPGDRFTIDAGAISDYMLESKTPIPEELVKQLGKASFLTVRVADIPAALGFDAVRLRDVLAHLDNCRRLLAGRLSSPAARPWKSCNAPVGCRRHDFQGGV